MGSRSGGDSSSEKPSPTPTVVKYARRRASVPAATTTTTPCGACKFLRRKCTVGCVFAAHFASEQGAARFAAVHKVFGASNVSKLLLHLPPTRRRDAVATICYEAQARLSDPVYGCVATVLALQQQVAALQAELSVVQANLMNTRLAVASAIQNPQNTHNITTLLNTTYSETSDDLTGGPHRCFDLAAFPEGPGQLKWSQEDEGESGRNPIVFVDDIFQQK